MRVENGKPILTQTQDSWKPRWQVGIFGAAVSGCGRVEVGGGGGGRNDGTGGKGGESDGGGGIVGGGGGEF